MRFNNKNKIPPKYILLSLTILCLIFVGISYAFEDWIKPLRYVTGLTITPMQRGINVIGVWVDDKFDMMADIQSLQEENAELRAQLEEYQTENRIQLSDNNELNELRELYELDSRYPSYEKVAANVISKDAGNWFDTFIIDKGTNVGIQEGCNVIAGNGLVGIVTEVGPNYAKVRSIIDDNSNVSAMFLTDQTLCNVLGDEKYMDEGYIRVEYIDKDANISEGDELVTSNVSDKFLPGISIGYVSNLTLDSNNLTMSADVTPVVDFDHIQTVLVVLDLKQDVNEEE
ncbi:MAG: rod shape-determining protein MreC [Lachnospiraceae bacterium]|nr:rod shape-determining protein MreC [Lachnospiraceae bacterium]